MSGSKTGYLPDDAKATGSALGRKPAMPDSSMNEIIDRAFREPYYRFLLFLAALWRNWYWALPFCLIVGGALGALTYVFSKEQYTSEAWVRVHMQQPYIAFPAQHTREEAMAIVMATLQIIKSPPVMKEARDRIMEDSQKQRIDISDLLKKKNLVRWLTNNTSVRQQGESPVYIVSFTTKNPQLSELILQSIMGSYMEYMTVGNTDRSDDDIKKLLDVARLKQIDIEDLNSKFNDLAEKVAKDGIDLRQELSRTVISSNAHNPITAQIASLEAEIASQEILVKLNQEEVLDDEDDGTSLPDAEVEGDLYQHPMMAQLLKERIDLLGDLEKRSSSPQFTADTPAVKRIREKLEIVEKRIEAAREELLPDLKKQWKAVMKQLAHRGKLEAENRISQLKAQIKALEDANLKDQTKDESIVKDINTAESLQTQKAREEQVYDILISRIGVLQTEKRAHDQVVEISEASLPIYPDNNRRLRLSLLAAIMGLAVPVLLAWGRELWTPRFYHLSQFPTMFPAVSRETVAGLSPSGREGDMSKREKQAFYFSVDEICNNYCFGRTFAGKQVFLFSSVCNDDGQTLLALSVAERIANIKNQPVLLIDTHGSNPRLRNLVGVDGKANLADVLAMRLSINEAIVRDSQQSNLFFLPDGHSSENSSMDLFSDGTFEVLIRELRNHYCAIIISTPPMERSSGSHVLCHFADAVVVALRLYDTPRKNTEKLYERLVDVGKPISSFMVSGIPVK